MLALVREYVSAFCSNPDFQSQLVKQTEIRVKSFASLEQSEGLVPGDFDLKNIYWGIFLLMAFFHEPGKMTVLFLPLYAQHSVDLQNFLKRLSNEAASYYQRWAPKL